MSKQVKETRRTVRDSERGVEKIAVGHHINDRGHVIERSRVNGQMSENQEYINLDEGRLCTLSEYEHFFSILFDSHVIL